METKLSELRKQYVEARIAKDIKLMEKIAAIAQAIKNNNKCYRCKEKIAEFDGYYCSQECQDKYYPARGGRPSIAEMQRSIIENAKQSHIKTTPQEKLL